MIAAKLHPYPTRMYMPYYFWDQLEPETRQDIEMNECDKCFKHPNLTPESWHICEYHKGYDHAVEVLSGRHIQDEDPE